MGASLESFVGGVRNLVFVWSEQGLRCEEGCDDDHKRLGLHQKKS
jgi:hypothetical protein